MENIKWFAYNVRAENLSKAFDVLQKDDGMKGWQIKNVISNGTLITILATREFSYPYMERKIKEDLKDILVEVEIIEFKTARGIDRKDLD